MKNDMPNMQKLVAAFAGLTKRAGFAESAMKRLAPALRGRRRHKVRRSGGNRYYMPKARARRRNKIARRSRRINRQRRRA